MAFEFETFGRKLFEAGWDGMRHKALTPAGVAATRIHDLCNAGTPPKAVAEEAVSTVMNAFHFSPHSLELAADAVREMASDRLAATIFRDSRDLVKAEDDVWKGWWSAALLAAEPAHCT